MSLAILWARHPYCEKARYQSLTSGLLCLLSCSWPSSSVVGNSQQLNMYYRANHICINQNVHAWQPQDSNLSNLASVALDSPEESDQPAADDVDPYKSHLSQSLVPVATWSKRLSAIQFGSGSPANLHVLDLQHTCGHLLEELPSMSSLLLLHLPHCLPHWCSWRKNGGWHLAIISKIMFTTSR